MPDTPELITVGVANSEPVTAALYVAEARKRERVTIILAHGAGANQLHPFMRLFAAGLAERGFDVLTFNFQYMEQGRRAPDPKAKLEACYRAVIEAARKHKRLKGNRLVIGGKSMGGRIASQVAALDCGGSTPLSDAAAQSSQESKTHWKTKKHSNIEATRANESNVVQTPTSDIAGLVFLGYPLHPPGKPEQLRDAHLPQITVPMLFVQGSRDAFGSAEEIRATIKKHHLRATLHVVEGGDHSLKVPKSSGLSQQKVYDSAMGEIARWLKTEVRNPQQ
jgi:predicted alpha/beta-hydrolase family hydrolase